LGDLPPRRGRGGRGDRRRGQPGQDYLRHGDSRAGARRDGGHLHAGRRLRGSPQPGGHRGVRGAWQLPVEARASVPSGPAGRRDRSGQLSALDVRPRRQARRDDGRAWSRRLSRAPRRGAARDGPGRHDPGDGLRRSQRRTERRDRGRRLHRARGPVGRPGHRRLDESGAFDGARYSARRSAHDLDLRGRADDRRFARRWAGVDSQGSSSTPT
jgi:hypothetical protein